MATLDVAKPLPRDALRAGADDGLAHVIRDETADRAAIAAEARTWLGTPYAHGQRLKGVGADCAGVPLEVYAAVGLIPPTDVGPYSNQWHLHRSRERYLEWVERFAREIPRDQAKAGDFLVWRFGRTYSHGGILVDDCHVVHAYARVGKVILDNSLTHAELKNSPVKAFTFWPMSSGAVDGSR